MPYTYTGEIPLQFFFSGQKTANFVPHATAEHTFIEAVEFAKNDSWNKSYRRFEHHLKVVPKWSSPDSSTKPTAFNLVDILNRKVANPFVMKSKNHPNTTIELQGLLLLYACSQIYDCRIYIFSSRARPKVIYPTSKPKAKETSKSIAILQHCNMLNTQWSVLDVKPVKGKNKKEPDNTGDLFPAARRRETDEKKPRKPRTKDKSALDDEVLKYLKDEVKKIYHKKWISFSAKRQGKSNNVEAFSNTITTKSLPTGVANIVQTKIEWNIRNNEYTDFKPEDIPTSRLWVQQRINKLKQERFTIDELKASFIKVIAEERAALPTTSTSLENLNDEKEENVEELDGDEHRMISRTLSRVIREDVDFGFVLKTLEEQQKICSKSIQGLSEANKIFTSSIISGEIFPWEMNTFFNVKSLGIDTVERTCILGSKETDFLKKSGLLSYSGFWKILSHVVGQKNEEKEKDP